MATITGQFETVAEAVAAIVALEAAGIPRNAITVADQGENKGVELTVATDADHEQQAFDIVKGRGEVDSRRHVSNWPKEKLPVPADEVNRERRYVTENRDTSREP